MSPMMTQPQALHPNVLGIGMDFRGVAMSTPRTIAEKSRHLLHPRFPGERVAVIVADPIRCSSTVIAVLAAGAVGVTITVKGGAAGTTLEEAQLVGASLGCDVVLGGELHGQPIAGGIIGNSPRAVHSADLSGKLVHFSSTNFGAAFTEMVCRTGLFTAEGGNADLYVSCFHNVLAVSRLVRDGGYQRVFVGTGGFYDYVSLEDAIIAGQLLRAIEIDEDEADDEARTLMACAQAFTDPARVLRAFRSNWIGRALGLFGVDQDIEAVVTGDGIDPQVLMTMRRLIPYVADIETIPVITAKANAVLASCGEAAPPAKKGD